VNAEGAGTASGPDAAYSDAQGLPPLVSVREVTKEYRMGQTTVHALRGVSLQVAAGELMAIMGPSGSGKSTLMHLMGCLDTPTSGQLFLDGEAVAGLSEERLAVIRNRKIGFVFQQFNLLARITVLENVMTPLMYGRVGPRERRERAAEALERVGLSDRLRHRPTELSGGQRQRAAIARALVTRPSLILADEPTGALDTDTGRAILELFAAICAEGKTVIVVTHDPQVGEFCRRRVRLRDGLVE
jgi:putative ABC transport system ATP-binding protein